MTKSELQTILGQALFDTTWDSYLHPYRMRLIAVGFVVGAIIAVAAWKLLYQYWRPKLGDLPAFFSAIMSGVAMVLVAVLLGAGAGQVLKRDNPSVAEYQHYITHKATDPSSQLAARLIKDAQDE
jgi:uncharacterized membrane protein